ncbi:hypothetical protein H8959_017273 [Pygathrix nigripes]
MGTPLPSGGHGSLFVLLGLNPGRLHEANGTAVSPLPRHSPRVLCSASLRPAYCQYRLHLVQLPLSGTENSLSQTSGFDSLMTGKLRTLSRDAGREAGRGAARVGAGRGESRGGAHDDGGQKGGPQACRVEFGVFARPARLADVQDRCPGDGLPSVGLGKGLCLVARLSGRRSTGLDAGHLGCAQSAFWVSEKTQKLTGQNCDMVPADVKSSHGSGGTQSPTAARGAAGFEPVVGSGSAARVCPSVLHKSSRT